MGTLVLPAVNGRVMLAVPTLVGSPVSRKCVGSLLVNVMVGLAGAEGGAALRLRLPCAIRLLPTIGVFRLMSGAAPTLMAAVIVVIPGDETLRFAVPCVTPVTANVAVSCPG